MLFRPWKPKDRRALLRIYVDGTKDHFILKQKDRLVVKAPDKTSTERVIEVLTKAGIYLHETPSLDALAKDLDNAGLIAGKKAPPHTRSDRTYFTFSNLAPDELFRETLRLNPASSPFRAPTKRHGTILVDHREPDEIFTSLSETPLNVERVSLPDGDIFIHSTKDSTRKLLIERKTITDLYNGITGSQRHCHEQAERYWGLSQEETLKGNEMRVIWIIEAEAEGSRLLYNCLPEVKQVDGWVSYLTAILGQSIVQSYSTNHTAYLVAKFAQGFLEQSLYYPVKVGAARIDRTGTERQGLKAEPPCNQGNDNHGVIQGKHDLEQLLSLLPGVNSKTAKSLADTGKSLAEIAAMTPDELLMLKGIGEKTAQQLFRTFNRKQHQQY